MSLTEELSFCILVEKQQKSLKVWEMGGYKGQITGKCVKSSVTDVSKWTENNPVEPTVLQMMLSWH